MTRILTNQNWPTFVAVSRMQCAIFLTVVYMCSSTTTFERCFCTTSQGWGDVEDMWLIDETTTEPTEHPSRVTRWNLKFSPGNDLDYFSPGSNRKGWNLKIAEDTELVTGDPFWDKFLRGISPLALSFFTEVEASGALSRNVTEEEKKSIPFCGHK